MTEQELTDVQQIVLQSVYEIFKRDGLWPTFQYVEAGLDREHQIDLYESARAIRGYLINFDPHKSASSPVSLTVSGITCCRGASADLELFMRMLRWLRDRRLNWQPKSPAEAETLIVTSPEAQADWVQAGTYPSDLDLSKAYTLATAEGLSDSSGITESGYWTMTPANSLRRFRGVVTLADYLAVQRAEPVHIGPPETSVMPTIINPLTEPFVLDSADSGPPYVFILMPFEERWSRAVHAAIDAACSGLSDGVEGLEWQRADDISHPGRITDQIIAAIHRADAIVADVTDNNANVMFELGFAHALGKPVIVLNQSIPEAPFDIRDWRQIEYSLTDLDAAGLELSSFLRSVLDSDP